MKLFATIAVCLLALGAWAQTLFTWPGGVGVTGPYTMAGTLRTNLVFSPNGNAPTENDMATHQYNHHTRIAWQNGVIFLAFSSGNTNEEDGGQQCALSISTNKGVTWSVPLQVVPSQSQWTNTYGQQYQRISYPRNFTTNSGTLYLTCAVDQWDGSTNQIGVALMSRACYGGGTLGSLFLIATNAAFGGYYPSNGLPSVTYDQTLATPLYADSKIYGCWGGTYANFGVYASGWIGWTYIASPYAVFVEPNTFSMDGTTNNLYRIWRGISASNTIYWVDQAWSTDGGATWTDPVATSIPSCGTENTALRLSTGQNVIIGNPQAGNNRDPLYLAITSPNTTTITNVTSIIQGMGSTPVYAGHAKSGGASYCSATQVGNYLYIGYSIHKESIGFSRVLIPGLTDNNSDDWGTIASAGTVNAGTLRMAP